MIEKIEIISRWIQDYKCNLDLLQVPLDIRDHHNLIIGVLLLNISFQIMVLMLTREMVLQGTSGKTLVLHLDISDLLVLSLNKPVQ